MKARGGRASGRERVIGWHEVPGEGQRGRAYCCRLAGTLAGFDLVINLDHADRGFWRTNAPAFHNFAEYLREQLPVANVPGRTNLQRYLITQWQLDQAKLAYKAGKSAATSNALIAAEIALQQLSAQTAARLTIVTNSNRTTPALP